MDKHVPDLIALAKAVFMADPELRAAELRAENLDSEAEAERDMEKLRAKKQEKDRKAAESATESGGAGSKAERAVGASSDVQAPAPAEQRSDEQGRQ